MRPIAVAWLLAISAVVATTGSAFAQADTTHTAPLPPPPPVTGTEPDFPRGRISGLVFGDLYYNVAGDPTHHLQRGGRGQRQVVHRRERDSDHEGPERRPDPPHLLPARQRSLDQVLDPVPSRGGQQGADLRRQDRGLRQGRLPPGEGLDPAGRRVHRHDRRRRRSRTPRSSGATGRSRRRSSTSAVFRRPRTWAFRSRACRRRSQDRLLGHARNRHRPEAGEQPHKRAYLALPLRLIEDLRIEPYVDYEWIRTSAGERDRALYKLFAGYEFKRLALGGEVVQAGDPQPRSTRIRSDTRSSAGSPERPSCTPSRATTTCSPTPMARIASTRTSTSLGSTGSRTRTCTSCRTSSPCSTTRRAPRRPPSHHDMQARITFYYRFSKP